MCTVKDPASTGKEFFEHTLKLLTQSLSPPSSPILKLAPTSTPKAEENYQKVLSELKMMNTNLQAISEALARTPSQIVDSLVARLVSMQQQLPFAGGVYCDKPEIEKWIFDDSSTTSGSSITCLSLESQATMIEEDFERLSIDVLEEEEAEIGQQEQTIKTTVVTVKEEMPNSLYHHWHTRYSSSSDGEGSKFLFASPSSSPPSTWGSTFNGTNEKAPPKLLPYSSKIDLSVWLK